jgi:hypothetical protein
MLKPLATDIKSYTKFRRFKFQRFTQADGILNVEMFFRQDLDDTWMGLNSNQGILLFKSSPKTSLKEMKINRASSLPQEHLKIYSSGTYSNYFI